ncbi:MAG: hypothetical protein ACYDFT_03340, partial [Thermoplasmata archaeon]
MAAIYQTETDTVVSKCGTTATSASAVAVALSSNNGSTFSRASLLGDKGGVACPYFNALEPSFAVGTAGTVYGVYVLTSAPTSALVSAYSFAPPLLSYTARGGTGLAFVASSNNATNFSAPRLLLTGGYIARPSIAVYGRTIYVTYEMLENGTAALPGTGSAASGRTASDPISARFMYSTNEGLNWSNPITLPGHLPGESPTEYNTTLSPAVAVNATGALAMAYAANRSCVAWCGYLANPATVTDAEFADDVVVVTSAHNGSQWNGPFVAARTAGEAMPSGDPQNGGLFEMAPDLSLAWSSRAPSHLFLAYSASTNLSVNDPASASTLFSVDWSRTDVFTTTSGSGGSNWSAPRIAASPLIPEDPAQGLNAESFFNPGLIVDGASVALTYSYLGSMITGCGPSPIGGGTTPTADQQYLTTSSDGIHW